MFNQRFNLIPKDFKQLDLFLSCVNSLNSSIQFTMEVEEDKNLNFLDLSIQHRSNKFEFNIYRKSTYTDIVIPSSSAHPLNIKRSAFFSMLYRLVKILLNPSNLKAELNVIYTIAIKNGYDRQFIDIILRKVRSNNIKNPGRLRGCRRLLWPQ